MRMRSLVILFAIAASATAVQLQANNLTFDCDVTGPENATGVVLLHGFPEFKVFWKPLTVYWVQNDVQLRALACDLRGYSPGASPDDVDGYDYSVLATDVWTLADAMGFQTFHLAGHDHGSGLGWYVAAMANRDASTRGRLLSYSGLSVPHPDTVTAAFTNTSVRDMAQIVASNYFNQFALPDSMSINNGALSILGFNSLPFVAPASVQKALWWYNGSVGTHWARPQVVSDEVCTEYNADSLVLGARHAIPLPVDSGSPASAGPTGNVSGVPTLFVCGSDDPYLLCTHPYAMTQGDYIVGANYEYFAADCGHDVIQPNSTSGGTSGGCQNDEVQRSVLSTITQFMTDCRNED